MHHLSVSDLRSIAMTSGTRFGICLNESDEDVLDPMVKDMQVSQLYDQEPQHSFVDSQSAWCNSNTWINLLRTYGNRECLQLLYIMCTVLALCLCFGVLCIRHLWNGCIITRTFGDVVKKTWNKYIRK